PGMRIRFMATGAEFDVTEVGTFRPGMTPVGELGPGDVGYVCASIKNVRDTRVGDTITDARRPTPEHLPGYRRVNPQGFCGLYPVDSADYEDLREALEKLVLNDAAMHF